MADTRQWTKEITLAVKVHTFYTPSTVLITLNLPIFPIQDLAGKNNLNVTDIFYFSDYIPAKYQDIQNIVGESFRRTRSN